MPYGPPYCAVAPCNRLSMNIEDKLLDVTAPLLVEMEKERPTCKKVGYIRDARVRFHDDRRDGASIMASIYYFCSAPSLSTRNRRW